MRFQTYKSLKWSLIPAWGSFEANFYVGTVKKFNSTYDSLALWGGNSDGLFYVKGQVRDLQGNLTKESWDIRPSDESLKNYHVGGTDINVIERLINYSPGIGLVLTNPEPSVFNVYSKLGQGQIKERIENGQLQFSYQVIEGEDPLGFTQNASLKKIIQSGEYLSDQEWIKSTYLEHYPDAIRRISYSFENANSATIHIVAADGWDFTPYYVAKNVLVGSHGSLNAPSSLVPIMFYGPGIKNTEMPFARTVDILPTIVKYFGITTNVDGRPLPVFEDQKTNNEVINYSVSFDIDKTLADDNFYYALEDIYASYDKRIIRINKNTNQVQVLCDSIKEALPALNDKVNTTLKVQGFDAGAKELILRKIYVAEDKESGTYRFNVDTRKFL